MWMSHVTIKRMSHLAIFERVMTMWSASIICRHSSIHLLLAATRCNALHHAATRCNTLQHAATHCQTLFHVTSTGTRASLLCASPPAAFSLLQHTATHCNTLQHTATHCDSLLHKSGILIAAPLRVPYSSPFWLQPPPPAHRTQILLHAARIRYSNNHLRLQAP